jgi:hypothetical protein
VLSTADVPLVSVKATSNRYQAESHTTLAQAAHMERLRCLWLVWAVWADEREARPTAVLQTVWHEPNTVNATMEEDR